MELKSDSEDSDDELVQSYLKDNRVETILAKRKTPKVVYTPEELEKISVYKNALAINRERYAYYKQLEDTLTKMFENIKRKLKQNEAALLKQSNVVNKGSFNYLRCGKPYFKDELNCSAPDNDDTIMMKQAQMCDFSQVNIITGWTIKDKTELAGALLEASREIRKEELRLQISNLSKDKKNVLKIAKLEREITQLSKKTLAEIALPLDQEYDWDDIANTLNHRHTAQEYQALWKLFFHPSINKDSWTKPQQQELHRIAMAHNFQDWDAIAKELKMGRTGYQCFVYYRTNMVVTYTNRKWTNEEKECLQQAVEFFREGTYIPWSKVASAMEGRTKMQAYNKYLRMMEGRKGRFLEEEDVVLLNCYNKYGDDFRKISKFLPGRSNVQLRTRYNILTKTRRSTTWSVEEDRKLIQLMANMDRKTSFSTATKHFPGKDRSNIRSRYVTLMKWMKDHPASDISMAPRRGARRLLHGHATVGLKEAITNLNKRLESEVNIKKNSKITLQSSEKDIEDGIMALLVNEIIKEESGKRPDQSELGDDENSSVHQEASAENTNNLHNLLVFLSASLKKNEFNESKYASKYPKLNEAFHANSHLTVKSYSKLKTVETLEVDDSPDIWDQKPRLKRSYYVLPPNYATITGCRVLMKRYGTKPETQSGEDLNLSLMARRNLFLKQAIETLKERFTTLFMWPIMLSNEMPKLANKPYEPEVNSKLHLSKKNLKFDADQGEKDDSEDEIDDSMQYNNDLDEVQFSLGMPIPGSSIQVAEEVIIPD